MLVPDVDHIAGGVARQPELALEDDECLQFDYQLANLPQESLTLRPTGQPGSRMQAMLQGMTIALWRPATRLHVRWRRPWLALSTIDFIGKTPGGCSASRGRGYPLLSPYWALEGEAS
jgi:hypothetical protein